MSSVRLLLKLLQPRSMFRHASTLTLQKGNACRALLEAECPALLMLRLAVAQMGQLTVSKPTNF